MAVDDTIVATIIIRIMLRIKRIDMESEDVAEIASSRTNRAHHHNRNRIHPTILQPIRS